MGKKTGSIVYNVHQRGRKALGTDRTYDLRTLAALVNGDEVQERVKNRDLIGYYGHVVRVKFGFKPPETVFEDGKAIIIEPAVVTTKLSADDDGNLTHETEFLETDAGQMAARLFDSRQGGFSSAIFSKPRNGLEMPLEFGGFDYVFEPNYTTNRGYLLDSTNGGFDGMLLDAIMADWTQATGVYKAMYDSIERDHTLAMETLNRLREENEELMSMLSKRGPVDGSMLLDSTGGEAIRPMLLDRRATTAFARAGAMFKAAPLVDFDKLPDDKPGVEDDAALNAAKAKYGV